jgi:hypothetical protein
MQGVDSRGTRKCRLPADKVSRCCLPIATVGRPTDGMMVDCKNPSSESMVNPRGVAFVVRSSGGVHSVDVRVPSIKQVSKIGSEQAQLQWPAPKDTMGSSGAKAVCLIRQTRRAEGQKGKVPGRRQNSLARPRRLAAAQPCAEGHLLGRPRAPKASQSPREAPHSLSKASYSQRDPR